ncbi:MAG: DUF4254 domain-containing protein [Gemmatimonadales bacterium]
MLAFERHVLELTFGTVALKRLALCGVGETRLSALGAVHCRIWEMEDRARSKAASYQQVATLKGQIDADNRLRHDLIDEIDRSVLPRDATVGAARYSETIGELCDRLIVLRLKVEAAQGLASDAALPDESRAFCRSRGDGLFRWWEFLRDCLSDQLESCLHGRAVLAPRNEFKIYCYPEFNPFRRGGEERATLTRRDSNGP